MYRRTTIAATTMALALLGGGTALAANAGLFGSNAGTGAGTVPAVATLDNAGVPSETTPPAPGPPVTDDVSTKPGNGQQATHSDSGERPEGVEHSAVGDD